MLILCRGVIFYVAVALISDLAIEEIADVRLLLYLCHVKIISMKIQSICPVKRFIDSIY